jgi:hypothetical protein
MKHNKKPKLRCYVCGGELGTIFFLATPTDMDVDRVFLVCDEKQRHQCLNMLDKMNRTLRVMYNDPR